MGNLRKIWDLNSGAGVPFPNRGEKICSYESNLDGFKSYNEAWAEHPDYIVNLLEWAYLKSRCPGEPLWNYQINYDLNDMTNEQFNTWARSIPSIVAADHPFATEPLVGLSRYWQEKVVRNPRGGQGTTNTQSIQLFSTLFGATAVIHESESGNTNAQDIFGDVASDADVGAIVDLLERDATVISETPAERAEEVGVPLTSEMVPVSILEAKQDALDPKYNKFAGHKSLFIEPGCVTTVAENSINLNTIDDQLRFYSNGYWVYSPTAEHVFLSRQLSSVSYFTSKYEVIEESNNVEEKNAFFQKKQLLTISPNKENSFFKTSNAFDKSKWDAFVISLNSKIENRDYQDHTFELSRPWDLSDFGVAANVPGSLYADATHEYNYYEYNYEHYTKLKNIPEQNIPNIYTVLDEINSQRISQPKPLDEIRTGTTTANRITNTRINSLGGIIRPPRLDEPVATSRGFADKAFRTWHGDFALDYQITKDTEDVARKMSNLVVTSKHVDILEDYYEARHRFPMFVNIVFNTPEKAELSKQIQKSGYSDVFMKYIVQKSLDDTAESILAFKEYHINLFEETVMGVADTNLKEMSLYQLYDEIMKGGTLIMPLNESATATFNERAAVGRRTPTAPGGITVINEDRSAPVPPGGVSVVGEREGPLATANDLSTPGQTISPRSNNLVINQASTTTSTGQVAESSKPSPDSFTTINTSINGSNAVSEPTTGVGVTLQPVSMNQKFSSVLDKLTNPEGGINLREKFEDYASTPRVSPIDEVGLNEQVVYLRPTETTSQFGANLATVMLGGRLRTIIERRFRRLENVFDGMIGESETLIYKVLKYKVREDGTTSDTPVQTFWIPNLEDVIKLKYVDTQIKYGEKYLYRINVLHAIVGTKYHYDTFTPEQDSDVSIVVTITPSVRLVEAFYYEEAVRVLDTPPLAPEVDIAPYVGRPDVALIRLNDSVGRIKERAITIGSESEVNSDLVKIREAQKIIEGGLVTFSTDEPNVSYEVYRAIARPRRYSDFSSAQKSVINVKEKTAFADKLLLNQKYYYIFRSRDAHGHLSNPSSVFQVELVDEDGTYYMIVDIIDMEEKQEDIFTKPMMRYVQISPTLGQTIVNMSRSGLWEAESALGSEPVLGRGEDDSVFGKKFKIRFISKHTGKKIDLNLEFIKTLRSE